MVFLNASGLVLGVLYPEIEFTTLGELSMLEGMIVFGYTHKEPYICTGNAFRGIKWHKIVWGTLRVKTDS